MLFDPYAGGHHAEHVRHIMTAWQRRDIPGALCAAVSPKLVKQHPDLRALTRHSDHQRIELLEVPEALEIDVPDLNLLRAGLQHRALLRTLIERHRPDHLALLYLDHAQLGLATGLRFPFPVHLSGVLFRPSFHYGSFEETAPPLKERLQRLRKRLVLQAALRNPHLDTVFTLDPTAVPAIQALAPGTEVVALPDPVEPIGPSTPPTSMREAYGVSANRTLALLFGALTERKGVLQVLDALALLPEATGRQFSVLLAGRVAPDLRPALEARVRALASSPIEVVVSPEFVPDDQIQSLIRASDLVLVPYQCHIGSSGVLIRAAAAERPVVGQTYGLVGHQIRSHCLGQAVDTSDPHVLAGAFARFVEDPTRGFDAAAAHAFAAGNTTEAYLDAFLSPLLSSSPARDRTPDPGDK